jgi:hypothetical protein
MNSKKYNITHLYRGINDFQRGNQPTNNIVKDETGDLLADSHILNKWKIYFSQLLNIHRVGNVRQIEIHTAELLVPDPSPFEVEIAIAVEKGINLQVVIKFWQNRFMEEVKHYGLRYINSLILFGIRKNCLISGRSLLSHQFT